MRLNFQGPSILRIQLNYYTVLHSLLCYYFTFVLFYSSLRSSIFLVKDLIWLDINCNEFRVMTTSESRNIKLF